MPSFDVVSKVDMQEVKNAVQHALKEMFQRYDFKGTKSNITIEDEGLTVLGDNEFKLEAVKEILTNKLNKRGISPRCLDMQKVEAASGGMARQVVKITQGVASDKAKEINKFIKESGLKVTTETQKDQIRITGKKRDDLQEVIALLKGHDFGPPLQFINFRE